VEKLIKGNGDDAHQRELHKALALAGISTEDLNNPEAMQAI
jgi:hypothetical protein